MASFIRCQRTAETLQKKANPAFKVEGALRGKSCYIGVKNKEAEKRLKALKEFMPWQTNVLSHGALEVNGEWRGEIPTIDAKAMQKRIEKCGGVVTTIHSMETLKGGVPGVLPATGGRDLARVYGGGIIWDIAHVHLYAEAKAKRCLLDKLLEAP